MCVGEGGRWEMKAQGCVDVYLLKGGVQSVKQNPISYCPYATMRGLDKQVSLIGKPTHCITGHIQALGV